MADATTVFGRLRAGLRRTAEQIGDRVNDLLGGGDSPRPAVAIASGETLAGLEALLLQADVGMTATERIVSSVRERRPDELRHALQHEVLAILRGVNAPNPVPAGSRPRVVLAVGVNGTGKTTTVGKLAHLLRMEGQRPLLCAADTFRAAAVDQLRVWSERAGVDIVAARAGADPAAVVFDAIAAGRARDHDVVLVDTAGRLHTRANLMKELDKIRRVAAREVDGAPQEVLLVLDATVGQNGITQAREFLQAALVTGIVLTKLDGTAKGGVAVAIASELGLPIRYVGVGEGIDDLLPFSPEAYVDGLFASVW